jgi:hypothetical protein
MRINFWKKYSLIGMIISACLLSLSPARLGLWQLTPDGLQAAAWQTAAGMPAARLSASQDLRLTGGILTITSPNGNWQSPAGWIVQQADWTDLNHDNQPEVTLLVQRPFEPWPVDKVLPYGGRIQSHQDASGHSSHIILIGWKKDHWAEVWAGSALARPVRSFIGADLNLDGKQELLVREGSYQDSDLVAASTLSVWQWNGFGFDLITRLERSSKRFDLIISKQNQPLILLQ